QTWFQKSITPEEIAEQGANQCADALTAAIPRIIELAETYYDSSRSGYVFIPARQRLAICLAARLYRAIGRKVLRNPATALQRRIRLSLVEKCVHLLAGIGEWLTTLVPAQRRSIDEALPGRVVRS
ncbi:MAG: squalene/phytoene synthase family protein, partial [Limisphaerales bacterium]